MVMSLVDVNAQRKGRKHGIEAEMSDNPRRTSCHATVDTAPMLGLEPVRNLKFADVVATEKAATNRRNEKRKMTTSFFETLSWALEVNQTGNARMTSSVTTSSVVVNAQRAL